MHPIIYPITIDYSLSIRQVREENLNLDISNLTIDQLKGMANGKIFFVFEDQRDYFFLETGIIDYLLQFKRVYRELESGTEQTNSISCDYYYNCLEYNHDVQKGTLAIKDELGRSFNILVNFQEFMNALKGFINSTAEELRVLYPDLGGNPHFTENFPKSGESLPGI